MALLLGGACAVGVAIPAGANFLFPTALADGADSSSCFALSEITATTSWCVKSCGAKPSICPPDLCSCSSPPKASKALDAKASASAQKVVLFVDPDKHALDAAGAQSMQAEQQAVPAEQQQVNASLVDEEGTHLPAKAMFKALEFGNPSAIGMVNINDTFVNGSVALQADAGVNQSAKAFWRTLEFGKVESIANTTYMNGTVVAAKLDATVLQEAEQAVSDKAVGHNVSDKAFWRDMEFGKVSESIANTTYMNGTVVNAPLELQSTEEQVDAVGPVNQSVKGFWRTLEFGKQPIDPNMGNTTYMNGTVVVPATIMPKADATVLSAAPAVAAAPARTLGALKPAADAPAVAAAPAAAIAPVVLAAPAVVAAPKLTPDQVLAEANEGLIDVAEDVPATKTQVLLRALDTAAAAVPATATLGAREVKSPKGGMSFINFLSFKKSKDALPEDPGQAIEKTSAPAEAARNPWASRHETPEMINQQQLGLAETVALINAQGAAAMEARQAAAPAHEKGYTGILRGATDVEKQSAEQRAEVARKNFEQAVAATEQTKALEDANVPGTFRPAPPVELAAPAAVPGAIAFSSFTGGAGLFSAFENSRSSADEQLEQL